MMAKGLLEFAGGRVQTFWEGVKPDVWKWLVVGVGTALAIIYRREIAEVVSLVRDKEGLIEYLAPLGAWGAVLLVVVLMLQVVVAAIPGHLLYAAGGYVYGFWAGFLMTYTATVVIGQCTFYLARVYGQTVVEKLVPEKDLAKWEKIAARQGMGFFILTFVIPIFPADVMPYLAGLGRIRGREFLAANLIGRLPTVILMVLVGSHGLEVNLKVLFAAVVVTLALLGVVKWIGERVERKYVETEE